MGWQHFVFALCSVGCAGGLMACAAHEEPQPETATQAAFATKIACKQTFSYASASGTFTDGSASVEDYANNLSHCYKIKPLLTKGQTVQMRAVRWDLEEEYDYVQVLDLRTRKVIDARMDPDTTYRSTSGFLLWFRTDESETRTGFALEYFRVSGEDESEEEVLESILIERE